MNDGTARITAEWALWAKEPGAREDYTVLDNSAGMFDRHQFAEIISRYGSGPPDSFPQVTISWVRDGDDAHLGLAIQNRTTRVDHWRRPIDETRYFCVPYAQIASAGLTYEALYDAFDPRRLPADGVLDRSVLRPNTIDLAKRADGTAMHAAALLLSGKFVCVVRGDQLDMRTRLRFLDTVAALLPYGMRTKLAASTWTSSTAAHRIRLSFCGRAKDDAHTVVWDERPAAHDDGIAARYFALLHGHPNLVNLIDGLAAETTPLNVKDPLDREYALRLLEDRCGVSRAHRPAVAQIEATQPDVRRTTEDLLISVAECLEGRRPVAVLDGFVQNLRHMSAGLGPEERVRCQEIVKDHGLLFDRPQLEEWRESALRDAVLETVYGPSLTHDAVDGILDAAEGMTPHLLDALRRMPVEDTAAGMILAFYAGEKAPEFLSGTHTEDLIAHAALRPPDERLVRVAHAELIRRSAADEVEAPIIARALYDHGYLTDAVGLLEPSGEQRLARYCELLAAAYHTPLTREQFQEVVAHPAALSCEPLLIAAVIQHGRSARDLLFPTIVNAVVSRSRVGRQTRKQVEALLFRPPSSGSADPPTAAPPNSFGSPDPRRHRSRARRLIDGVKNPRDGGGQAPTLTSPLALLAIFLIASGLVAIGVVFGVLFTSPPGEPAVPGPTRSPSAQQTRQAPAGTVPSVQPPLPANPRDNSPAKNRRSQPQQGPTN